MIGELPIETAVALAALAFATSTLSAIVGMAGGIILLSSMLLVLDPLVALPIHAVIQLASNGSRSLVQRQHVQWPLVWRYMILLLPAGYIALQFARGIEPDHLKAGIGVFVLIATWKRSWLTLGAKPTAEHANRTFFLLGGAAGALNVVIGAVGPMLAPFFLGIGLSRQAIIGTKAICQMAGHLVKIILFGATGFLFLGYFGFYAMAIPAVFAGTWFGSRLLDKVDERQFTILFKAALTGIALFLILRAGLSLAARA
ncbi:MAG: sulfite exporter TauE/SafE family protein [Deltaproteobacteria bacterium]